MAIELLAQLDGTVFTPKTPIVRGDDLGIVRGDGIFEAFLATKAGPRSLDAHLKRLVGSAAILNLPMPDGAAFRRAIDAVQQAWDWTRHPEAVVRLFYTRGPEATGQPTGWVAAAPLDPEVLHQRQHGVRAMLLDRGFGPEVARLPWLLSGAKTLSYAVNMAAKRYAAAHDADDVVFHAPDGTLLEGPTSAVVLDLDGVLVTPPPEGILASITLEELIAAAPDHGLKVTRDVVTRQDLAHCRGAWLISSGRVLARITHIDGEPVGQSLLDDAVHAALGIPAS